MAISWEVTISNVNLSSGRGDVLAVRTDSESALEPRRYNMQSTPLSTAQQRTNALNTIKEWDEAAVAQASQIETFLDNLEQSAKTALENWELTR